MPKKTPPPVVRNYSNLTKFHHGALRGLNGKYILNPNTPKKPQGGRRRKTRRHRRHRHRTRKH
jgi:hypothetical protein